MGLVVKAASLGQNGVRRQAYPKAGLWVGAREAQPKLGSGFGLGAMQAQHHKLLVSWTEAGAKPSKQLIVAGMTSHRSRKAQQRWAVGVRPMTHGTRPRKLQAFRFGLGASGPCNLIRPRA